MPTVLARIDAEVQAAVDAGDIARVLKSYKTVATLLGRLNKTKDDTTRTDHKLRMKAEQELAENVLKLTTKKAEIKGLREQLKKTYPKSKVDSEFYTEEEVQERISEEKAKWEKKRRRESSKDDGGASKRTGGFDTNSANNSDSESGPNAVLLALIKQQQFEKPSDIIKSIAQVVSAGHGPTRTAGESEEKTYFERMDDVESKLGMKSSGGLLARASAAEVALSGCSSENIGMPARLQKMEQELK